MFWLKGCPKCLGDLRLERDEMDEEEIFCMQCGFRHFDPAIPAALMPLSVSNPLPSAQAA